VKALARDGGRLPGGSATPVHRIVSAADWAALFLPSALLLAEMLQPILIISVSFRS